MIHAMRMLTRMLTWIRVPLAASVVALLVSPLPRTQTPPTPVAAAPAVATASERPFLWRLEGPTPSYLFGTIHLPDERVTKFGPAVRAALDGCDALFTELPMELGELMKMQPATQLPKGEDLAGVLGEELYARVAAYVVGKGKKMAMFDRAQPWAVATQLGMLDQLDAMMTKLPLDMQIYSAAKKAKKVVGGLETVDEQLAVFGGLTVAEQRALVGSTIDRLEQDAREGKSSIERLLQVYLRGDEAGIDKEMNEFKMGDEALRKKLMGRLLADRNLHMADRIVRHVQEHPERCHVFAVGAAHYPGELGLLQLLSARGYRLVRLDLADPAAAQAREAEALDAEIARRSAEVDKLKARRERLQPVGSGR